MEQPLGLLSLPVELVQHISRFLSVEDILACSLTCHYLRSALNDNSVWKRYLPEKDISSLETQRQLVQPTLHMEHSFTPLCNNRLHFIRKTHLMNNWRTGHFDDKGVKIELPVASRVLNRTKGIGQLIFRHKYIFLGRFINDIHRNAIEVWNIENEPILQAEIKIENNGSERFYIMGTYLVVIECMRVDVYEIKLPEKEFPLAYSFFITEEKEVTFHERVHHPSRHDFRCVRWSYFSVDQYLICNKFTGSGDCVIHVWDIINAVKVGAFLSPIPGSSLHLHSNYDRDWLFVQNSLSIDNCVFFFNLERKEFSTTVFIYQSPVTHFIFHDFHVLIFINAKNCNSMGFRDTVCTVYDFKTSKELKKRRFNNADKNNQLSTTTVVNGTFVLLCFDCFQVIDALSLETVYYFKTDENIHYIKEQFCLSGSVFIVTNSSQCTSELWDIQNKRKVVSLGNVCNSHLYLDEDYTKLVCFNSCDLSVLHFW